MTHFFIVCVIQKSFRDEVIWAHLEPTTYFRFKLPPESVVFQLPFEIFWKHHRFQTLLPNKKTWLVFTDFYTTTLQHTKLGTGSGIGGDLMWKDGVWSHDQVHLTGIMCLFWKLLNSWLLRVGKGGKRGHVPWIIWEYFASNEGLKHKLLSRESAWFGGFFSRLIARRSRWLASSRYFTHLNAWERTAYTNQTWKTSLSYFVAWL